MTARRLRGAALLLALAAASAAVMAADKARIESVWSAEPPAIDGKLTDWPSPLASVGSAKLSIAARNDGEFLYVALAASDPSVRMMLGAAGFTVWWDPAGKEKKAFGITVPPAVDAGRGMRGRGPGGAPPDQDPRPPGDPLDPQDAQPPASRPERAVLPINHIEVAGPGKDDRRRLELPYARTIGLDAAVRTAEGVLVYELKVPLSVSEAQPYGVKSAPGAIIGLGIETSDLPRPEGRGREGERGRGGGGMGGGPPGGGGMGGGMGGGSRGGMTGGGPPGGGREGRPELKPVKQWMVLQLAKAPG